MEMKTIIITGANSGLGFKTAQKSAKASAEFRIILACRNMEKAEDARRKIKEELDGEADGRVVCMELDTASLSSVRTFAAEYAKRDFGPIYALVCNAGISGSHTGLTADGYDVIFETNHLGHFLLTKLLLPSMASGGRIFATSSDMHDPFNAKLCWRGADALAHPDEKLSKSPNRYAYSKLCSLYFIYELARRAKEKGLSIFANAFNPGLMKTNFMPLNKAAMESVKLLMPKRFGDLEKSSDAYAKLITDASLITASGQYFDRSTRAVPSSDLSYSRENAAELWEYSEMCCRLSESGGNPGNPAHQDAHKEEPHGSGRP